MISLDGLQSTWEFRTLFQWDILEAMTALTVMVGQIQERGVQDGNGLPIFDITGQEGDMRNPEGDTIFKWVIESLDRLC